MRLLIFLCLLTALLAQVPQIPIIGVYTQDGLDPSDASKFKTYIAASYVKSMEMVGAQVVPIYYHYSKSELESVLGKINGVLFPGGDMPIDIDNQWTSNVAFILQYANRQNQAGNPYPIWATCLGEQTILYISSGIKDNSTVVTEVFGLDGAVMPLIIKNTNSELLKTLTPAQYDAVKGKGVFYFHQRWSITLDTYRSNTGINSFWKLISTNVDVKGTEYVSLVQAYDYPYYLSQFHPQKSSFEWRVNVIDHSYYAVAAEQKFMNHFMKAARLNKNRYPLEELDKAIIYNYNPRLTAPDDYFVQMYEFDESKYVHQQKNLITE